MSQCTLARVAFVTVMIKLINKLFIHLNYKYSFILIALFLELQLCPFYWCGSLGIFSLRDSSQHKNLLRIWWKSRWVFINNKKGNGIWFPVFDPWGMCYCNHPLRQLVNSLFREGKYKKCYFLSTRRPSPHFSLEMSILCQYKTFNDLIYFLWLPTDLIFNKTDRLET